MMGDLANEVGLIPWPLLLVFLFFGGLWLVVTGTGKAWGLLKRLF